jgi:hypothetical protein
VLLDRHEDAARASIARYYPGRDLNEVFTGSMTPDECWALIIHLPRTSPLKAALAEDPDIPLAEPGDPPWTEFSPEVQAIAEAVDVLKSLLANVISLGGGKPPKFRPYPRPDDARREAAEKARFAGRWAKHKALAARILRKKGADGG